LKIGVWLDIVRVLSWGVVGVLWRRVWGVEEEGTLLVNAALAHWVPGKMREGAEPIIVDV